MENKNHPRVYKYAVATPQKKWENNLRATLGQMDEILQLDVNLEKNLLRIISSAPLETERLNRRLAGRGLRLTPISENVTTKPAEAADNPTRLSGHATGQPQPAATALKQELTVCIAGMTCRSCELTIERQWKKLPGVRQVDVNAATGRARLLCAGEAPSIPELQSGLDWKKYQVRPEHDKKNKTKLEAAPAAVKPSFMRLAGLFALVLVLGNILSKWGLLKPDVTFGAKMSFGAIFVIGLVAASSSCLAVTGGLLLSTAARFNERYRSLTRAARFRPVLLFVLGRIASYTLLGGLLGVVGKALTPSPFVTALVTILAAAYMLIMGLDMLGIAPAWLKVCLPRLPKSFSHKILDADNREHWGMPFVLGGATFFLPCGFTQALQLYALTTGSFAASALSLLAFALGTAPALLALGAATSSMKGKFGRWFFQFSGALVIVLGLWNVQNGLTIAGYPISFSGFRTETTSAAGLDGNVKIENGKQVARMAVSRYGYEPAEITVKAGMPVRWEVDGTDAAGCGSVLISRALGIQELLRRGLNVFEFTPKNPGTIEFSCSMGMYRGRFRVVGKE